MCLRFAGLAPQPVCIRVYKCDRTRPKFCFDNWGHRTRACRSETTPCIYVQTGPHNIKPHIWVAVII
jgi:hypothetical protein